jgi:hypothetical protein
MPATDITPFQLDSTLLRRKPRRKGDRLFVVAMCVTIARLLALVGA